MNKQMIEELTKMGITVVVLDHPDKAIEVHEVLKEIFKESNQEPSPCPPPNA